MKKVSVIIPTYNCAKYVSYAIDSALNQSYENKEIIVIDDGSTDHTKELLKKYKGEIKYLYQNNRGLSCARNSAMQSSSGEYIALLDSDDIWLPGRLSEQIYYLENDKEIGLVHSDVIMINEHNEEIGVYKREKKYLSGFISKNLLLRRAHISCPTVIFRKNCIDKVGMFDESLTRLGVEDRDLWIRITKMYKALYVDKPLALYRITTNSMSANRIKMIEARKYVINKYCERDNYSVLFKLQCLSALYLEIADSNFSKGNYLMAYNDYMTSIKYLPFNFLSWFHLLKSIIKNKMRTR